MPLCKGISGLKQNRRRIYAIQINTRLIRLHAAQAQQSWRCRSGPTRVPAEEITTQRTVMGSYSKGNTRQQHLVARPVCLRRGHQPSEGARPMPGICLDKVPGSACGALLEAQFHGIRNPRTRTGQAGWLCRDHEWLLFSVVMILREAAPALAIAVHCQQAN